jgi:hypothetical protein
MVEISLPGAGSEARWETMLRTSPEHSEGVDCTSSECSATVSIIKLRIVWVFGNNLRALINCDSNEVNQALIYHQFVGRLCKNLDF